MTKVGFIGLGIMGGPMAANLQAGGCKLYLHDLKNPPLALVEAGATVCTSATEVAKRADVIIVMVPDTPHVEEVLFGADGVAAGLTPGKIVVDMSSISPMATKEFARKINKRQCDYLDAPVSGGEVGARAASLTIMVGGSQEAFERVRPLFELMGKNITLVGAKAASLTIMAGGSPEAFERVKPLFALMGKNITLVGANGDGQTAKVRQALMGGFAASRILEVHGERMVKRTFAPGFRIELHQKDLNLALQGARSLGLSLPNTATAQELMNSCAAHGMAQLDHSALCQAIERMSNHAIAAD